MKLGLPGTLHVSVTVSPSHTWPTGVTTAALRTDGGMVSGRPTAAVGGKGGGEKSQGSLQLVE